MLTQLLSQQHGCWRPGLKLNIHSSISSMEADAGRPCWRKSKPHPNQMLEIMWLSKLWREKSVALKCPVVAERITRGGVPSQLSLVTHSAAWCGWVTCAAATPSAGTGEAAADMMNPPFFMWLWVCLAHPCLAGTTYWNNAATAKESNYCPGGERPNYPCFQVSITNRAAVTPSRGYVLYIRHIGYFASLKRSRLEALCTLRNCCSNMEMPLLSMQRIIFALASYGVGGSKRGSTKLLSCFSA